MPNTIHIAHNKRLPGNLHSDVVIEALHQIIDLPELDSRQYLQAHHFLNEFITFSKEYTKLYGVDVEVEMPDGCDLVAVYEDQKARYYNSTERRF